MRVGVRDTGFSEASAGMGIKDDSFFPAEAGWRKGQDGEWLDAGDGFLVHPGVGIQLGWDASFTGTLLARGK